MESVATEPLIHGGGTPESVWRAWETLTSLPPLAVERWVLDRRRLVVVAPHPDDEVLSCGALMQAHAQAGGEICVVGVTDGEASHADSSRWAPGELAQTRRQESGEGLVRLGLRAEIERLEVPDGRVGLHFGELEDHLCRLLRATDVVATTWRLDGHPDHETTALATAAACTIVGCELIEAPVWMWHWASPGDARVPWHRMRRVHVPARAIERKQRAIAAHASQLEARERGLEPVLGTAILDRVARDAEYFIV
jgi:LmbE family N-acetylglucosaminyl deacetylase